MLFLFKLRAEKNKPKEKNVNRAPYGRMLFDFLPGFFHFLAPMDVIKNKN